MKALGAFFATLSLAATLIGTVIYWQNLVNNPDAERSAALDRLAGYHLAHKAQEAAAYARWFDAEMVRKENARRDAFGRLIVPGVVGLVASAVMIAVDSISRTRRHR